MTISGIIVVWSGSIVSIPSGWILCNGAGGSPDLRNKFVVGAGDIYAVDASAGGLLHNHDFTGDGHTHDIGGGAGLAIGTDFSDTTNYEAVTGTTDNANAIPPYYSLAYIMKT